jgi:RimJ/RimL family protein N-acetyltransferase
MLYQPLHFHTPRLHIREMTLEDASPIWAFTQSAQHRQYEPDAPRTLLEFRDIVTWIIGTQTEKPRLFHYVTVALAHDPLTPIGSVHISIRDELHRQAEVGYAFNQDHWGKGYCTEATRVMVNFAFSNLHMHRVYATDIVSENTASVRVAQKLGMHHEGTFRQTLFFNERWWDTCTYAILADEWRGL